MHRIYGPFALYRDYILWGYAVSRHLDTLDPVPNALLTVTLMQKQPQIFPKFDAKV